jgi:hypothetical protein
VYIIGGDGTQKGAYEIFKVIITRHVDSCRVFFSSMIIEDMLISSLYKIAL